MVVDLIADLLADHTAMTAAVAAVMVALHPLRLLAHQTQHHHLHA